MDHIANQCDYTAQCTFLNSLRSKRLVCKIKACTFSNIVVLISGDKALSPCSNRFRLGFSIKKYSSMKLVISTMKKEVLRILDTATKT